MLLLRRRRLKVKLRRCFNLVPATALATSLRLEVEVESVEQGFRVYQGQQVHATMSATPQPPAMRPRVGARRGQATDPHSIAERLRRERIAERIGALQELVPSVNKTDRAAMLDEIVDYVKFLRLPSKGSEYE